MANTALKNSADNDDLTLAPVSFSFPLPRTHTGVLLGNGCFGVSLWGQDGMLCITLNRADFWDRRGGEMIPGENLFDTLKALYDPLDATSMDAPFEVVGATRPKGAFRNTRLPMGRFELRLGSGWVLKSADLLPDLGEVHLRVCRNEEWRVIKAGLHPERPWLWLDAAGVVDSVQARPAWEWVAEAMATRGYREPLRLSKSADESGWAQDCPEDAAMAAVCRRLKCGGIMIVMEAGDDAEAAVQHARCGLAEATDTGATEFFRAVNAWWRDYFTDLPRLASGDPFWDAFYRQAVFKFGAATSPTGGVPSGLQGPWCEEYQLPTWSADYHFNVNIQMIYTLAFSIGKYAHLLPLFDMLDRCLPVFREQARRMVSIDDGILITHTTDDRGYACGGVGPGASIDHAVSGWVAHLYWLYFSHTGDDAFLRERALPFMRGVMRVFSAMLEWDGDRPRLPISISAEYGQQLPGQPHEQRVGPNPSYQLACMHMLARDLITGCEHLGETPDPEWARILSCLPPWTLVGDGDQSRIAIWEGLDLEVSHRHHSHLACIYPFDSLTQRTPADNAVIGRSLHRWLQVGMSDWSEWCYPWAAIIEAREGFREGPLLLLNLCRELYINEGMATVYQPRLLGFNVHALHRLTGPLDECEIMQLDGTMGIATALLEMLVHCHAGTVRFFPACPERWPNAAFSNASLPGGLIASGAMRKGTVATISLVSPRGGAVCIDVPGYEELAITVGGTTRTVQLPHKLTLEPDQRLEGAPTKIA